MLNYLFNQDVVVPLVISLLTSAFTMILVWQRQKRVEDNFSRSKTAFELVLKHEFEYYEKTNIIYAELIPSINDIENCLTNKPRPIEFEFETRQEQFLKYFPTLLKSVVDLKNLIIAYEIYLPKYIHKEGINVVIKLQSSLPFLNEEMKKLHDGSEDEIDKIQCEEVIDDLLMACYEVRQSIKKRLHLLSHPNWNSTKTLEML